MNPHSRVARVNGTVMASADGARGSWAAAARVPGQDWVAAPGRPRDTFNFGYSAMALLPDSGGGAGGGAQLLGVVYQNGWIGNEVPHPCASSPLLPLMAVLTSPPKLEVASGRIQLLNSLKTATRAGARIFANFRPYVGYLTLVCPPPAYSL